MIAAWMLTASVIGALLLLAALAGDAACARLGWPRRWLWATTMVAMCGLPVVPHALPLLPDIAFISFGQQPIAPAEVTITPLVRPTGAPTAPSAPTGATPLADGPSPVSPVDARPVATGTPLERSPMRVASATARGPRFFVTDSSPLMRADAPLLALWAGLSVTVVLLVAIAMHRLRRERATWAPADGATRRAVRVIAGDAVPVWRSTQLGPAAFGLGAMHVVLPQWIDELSTAERSLLIAHEAEHVRERDPRLLAVALALVAALPWHLPLVFAYRRLCRAVEHDCDARVLAVHADVRSYGRLLVRTAEWLLEGQRTWRGPGVARWILAPVPAFAAPASELEARLRALGRRRGSWHTRLGALLGGIGALVAVTMACAVPVPKRATVTLVGPEPIEAAVADPVAASLATPLRRDDARRRPDDESARIVAAVRAAVPDIEQLGRTGTLRLWLLLDAQDRVREYRIVPRHRHAWDAGARDPLTPRVARRAATPATPATRLVIDEASFGRAFPTLDPARIAAMGDRRLATAAGPVAVAYARLLPGDDTEWSLARDAGVPVEVPAWFRTVAIGLAQGTVPRQRFSAALDIGLRSNLRWRVPGALAPTGEDGAFVWLVLGPTGSAIAHATGRDGMGRVATAEVPGTARPRATDATPLDELTIDRAAWRAKFPGLAAPVASYGWKTIRDGARDVQVLWAVTDLSLVTPSRPDATTPARRAGSR